MSARRVYPVYPEHRGELNRRGFVQILIIILFISLAALGTIAYLQFKSKPSTQTNNQNIETSYASQEECEAKTGKPCGYAMCDVVPAGKTFEETCGKGFKAGWRPISKSKTPTPNPTANWKTYTNTKRQYTFKYPASYQLSDSNPDSISIVLEGKENKITFYSGQVEITQPDHYKCDIGKNFNLGRYKTLYTRCLTTIDSVGTIEVGGNNGSGYDNVPVVILYNFNSGSNEQVFNQILSTFKFIN